MNIFVCYQFIVNIYLAIKILLITDQAFTMQIVKHRSRNALAMNNDPWERQQKLSSTLNLYRLLLSTAQLGHRGLLLTRFDVELNDTIRVATRRLPTNETAVSSSSSDSSTACNNKHRRDATRPNRTRGARSRLIFEPDTV